MNLFEAERNARALMHLHGLHGWTFKWDNAARRFGQCRYSTRTISMSRQLTVQRSADAVRNTMLHEIAHALTPGHGHDAVWRTKAISLGCDGKRCSADDVVVKYNYIAKCPAGHVAAQYIRRPKANARAKSCGKCSPRFDARYLVKVVPL